MSQIIIILLYIFLFFAPVMEAEPYLPGAIKDKYTDVKKKQELIRQAQEYKKDLISYEQIKKLYGNRGARIDKIFDIIEYMMIGFAFSIPIIIWVSNRRK